MDEFESLRNKLLTIKEQLTKAVNQSQEPIVNESSKIINKEEELVMSDNGQWNIKKTNLSSKRQ